MGSHHSMLPKASTDFPYFFLYFSYSDTITLALANKHVITTIRQSVVQCWFKGIQEEGLCEDGSYKIKLHGNPFKAADSDDEANQTKRICCRILSDLRNLGWTLATTSDLSRCDDRSTLFFQRSLLENESSLMICLSLSALNSLQLINAPEDLKAIFKDTVYRNYWVGVLEERTIKWDCEIKLNGTPWHTDDMEQSVCGRKLILNIFQRFDQAGFHFYGTINLKHTADCIFFVCDQDQSLSGNYLVVSLHQMDILRLINCPSNIVESTKTLIEEHWSKGLANETKSYDAYEFKLKGYPWWTNGKDAVMARCFITMLFQNFFTMGWRLVASLDISRGLTDKIVLVFHSCIPKNLPHFCISLNGFGKIRLLNAPKEIVGLTRDAVTESWPEGIKEESDHFGTYQFILEGTPWCDRGSNDEYLLGRCMMLLVLKNLMENGWRVVCSADVSGKEYHNDSESDDSEDVVSWFLAFTGDTKSISSNGTVATELAQPKKHAL